MSAGVGSATFRERSIQKGVPLALGQNTGMMDKETSTQGEDKLIVLFRLRLIEIARKLSTNGFVWEPGSLVSRSCRIANNMMSSLPHFSS